MWNKKKIDRWHNGLSLLRRVGTTCSCQSSTVGQDIDNDIIFLNCNLLHIIGFPQTIGQDGREKEEILDGDWVMLDWSY